MRLQGHAVDPAVRAMSEEVQTLTPGNWRQTDLAESDIAALLSPTLLPEVSADDAATWLRRIQDDYHGDRHYDEYPGALAGGSSGNSSRRWHR